MAGGGADKSIIRVLPVRAKSASNERGFHDSGAHFTTAGGGVQLRRHSSFFACIFIGNAKQSLADPF